MSDRVFIDTNVLVYASDPASPHAPASRRFVDQINAGQLDGCIAPQVLLEFFSVVTNPKRVSRARSSDEAWAVAEMFGTSMDVLPPPRDLVARVETLSRSLGLTGAKVYDAAIAATALAHGVTTVVSCDAGVFSRVPGLTVRTP
ncbi:MAG: PIN domain-containing protein [Polyangiaceae bacterium]|nr:PIN domain-containing protein [Polyangiaceae bacterium]